MVAHTSCYHNRCVLLLYIQQLPITWCDYLLKELPHSPLEGVPVARLDSLLAWYSQRSLDLRDTTTCTISHAISTCSQHTAPPSGKLTNLIWWIALSAAPKSLRKIVSITATCYASVSVVVPLTRLTGPANDTPHAAAAAAGAAANGPYHLPVCDQRDLATAKGPPVHGLLTVRYPIRCHSRQLGQRPVTKRSLWNNS